MKKSLVAAVLGTVVALTAAPAIADQKTFSDPLGDVVRSQADITSVKVKYGKKQTTISVRFAGLGRPDFSDYLQVWIDTDNRAKAPNYFLSGGGYESQFGSTSRWKLKPNGMDPYGDVFCSTGYKYDRAGNRMLFRFKSKCIGSPTKIRVAVTAEHYEDFRGDGTFTSFKDHLVAKRTFTRWVSR